jgi:hypothetical protein
MNEKRELLRHVLATIAYRGGKAVRGAPESFATFKIHEASRTPSEILAHVGDLFDWAESLAEGEQRWAPMPPGNWSDDVARFFSGLQRLDDYLASEIPLGRSVEELFQAPIADALTHVGQIAMLRRLAGCPIRGENYATADIVRGRLGPEQAAARVEFD